MKKLIRKIDLMHEIFDAFFSTILIKFQNKTSNYSNSIIKFRGYYFKNFHLYYFYVSN